MISLTRGRGVRAAVLALAVAAFTPAAAQAATDDAVVAASVGSELTMSAANPAGMTLTHATPGTTSGAVTVTSTASSWSLSIRDNAATGAVGNMRLTTDANQALENALEFRLAGGGAYSALTGTNQAVTSGALNDSKTIEFRQSLGATEDVIAGNNYDLTVLYTVIGA